MCIVARSSTFPPKLAQTRAWGPPDLLPQEMVLLSLFRTGAHSSLLRDGDLGPEGQAGLGPMGQ